MSQFNVTLERISSVLPHPNADRLDIVQVEGMDWDIITGRGYVALGDVVFFFPVDSVMPLELSDRLGITQNLKNGRIRTIKLRGMFSQGFIERLDKVFEVGTDFKDMLGVTKYEVPVDNSYGVKGNRSKTGVYNGRPGNLVALPDGVVKYDLENAANYKLDAQSLLDAPVYITEKVEGSHWGCTISADGVIQVFQRNFSINEAEEVPHAWWDAFRKGGFSAILQQIANFFPGQRVTIRGEITGPGIQGNYYDLTEAKVFVFEIELNSKPVSAEMFVNLCIEHGMYRVPALNYGKKLSVYLDGRDLKVVSDGLSLINTNKPREGIVIKPMIEQYSKTLQGRLVLKQRGPEYLAKSGN